jgi:CxxC motif-containing protein
MELICIKCPRGCVLTVDGQNISGNLCPRGADYAREELTCPMRTVTALVKTLDNKIVPVKTNIEVPKTKIDDVLIELSKIRIKKSLIGDVVIKNICNTGADIVVTGEEYNSN